VGDGRTQLQAGDEAVSESSHAALLREALLARADAEAAQVRSQSALEEAEQAREEAERARTEAELGRARLALLAEAGRQMASSIDWPQTIEAVVRSAVPYLADWVALTICEPDGSLRVVAVAHRDPHRERLAWEFIARHPLDPDDPTGSARVIRTGELELAEDLPSHVIREAAEDPEDLRLLENLNVRHFAIAPLRAPSGVIGTLTFVLGDSERRFVASDLELITTLAARAALHIQNSRLYTERRRVAEVLQAGLRPRAPAEIPGAETAVRFLPASAGLDVGGDFYDVFPSGPSAWSLMIGDVSGKGPEAAAVTALARHTLRSASLLLEDPAEGLALLNRALLADPLESHFCTGVFARVTRGPAGFSCWFANGGHPAPLLLSPDGRVQAVEDARGPLMGVFGDANYQSSKLCLAPGQLLLLYTDGVTEARRHEVHVVERRLRGILHDCAGASAEHVVSEVERLCRSLQVGQPRDDVALLAIRACEEEGARS
jgi:serine phosphatase RsbU (regulator of sigma subunit)